MNLRSVYANCIECTSVLEESETRAENGEHVREQRVGRGGDQLCRAGAVVDGLDLFAHDDAGDRQSVEDERRHLPDLVTLGRAPVDLARPVIRGDLPDQLLERDCS